jgi:hypothetical protein
MGKSSALKDWWHEGETPGCLVYRQQPLHPALVSAVVVIIAFGLHFEPRPLVSVALCLVAADCGLSFRRAIILGNQNVKYRPPIGNLVTIALSEIVEMESASASSGTTVFQRPGPGLKISTARGAAVFPLTVSNSDELLIRLRERTADKGRGSDTTLGRPAQ